MNPHDFVFNQVYRTAISEGVSERISKDTAISALEEYKKGRFKKPADLIKQKVSEAKRRQKKS